MRYRHSPPRILEQVCYPGNKYAWYLSPSILRSYRSTLKKYSADQVCKAKFRCHAQIIMNGIMAGLNGTK